MANDAPRATGHDGDESDDDAVAYLIAECLDQAPADVAAAVDHACARHPEHADELRRRMAALGRMNLLPHEHDRADTFPERLGEFRLLERLGGGGMGVVYRALQEPLGRTVALKLIRPEHQYFPRARERFRREAEAIAKLAHPGIVPIHTVGEAEGVPFFAMELFVGGTLADVITALQARAPESLTARDFVAAIPGRGDTQAAAVAAGTWVELVVRLVQQVAEALQHAHERGVLHRDVKPSNIAVSTDGRARLFDFGLATGGDDARLTAPGATLGTLLYMSPEQARGADVDQRSDVYSLGVTLYEALTLQVPFAVTDSAAARLAIAAHPPDPMRARNRAVGRDLEIVCLKAMARVAGDRYASAASFAGDLRAVLERRPIAARPPGPLLRLVRAVQRRPAAATALALAGTMAVGVPAGLWLVSRAHERELLAALHEAGQARAAAEHAEAEARTQSQRASLEAADSEAVAEFLIELFGAADPSIARGEDLRVRDLLDAGVQRLDAVLSGQPEVQRRLLLRMGVSYAGLGRHQEALPLLERAVAESVRLHGERSAAAAEANHRLAWTLRALGSPRAATCMAEALAVTRSLAAPERDDEIRYLVGMAAVHTSARDVDLALACYEEALALLPRAAGDGRELRQMILANRAHTAYSARRYAEAATDATQALALQREVYGSAHPGALAALNTLGLAQKHLERTAEAEATFAELLRVAAVVHEPDSATSAIFRANHAGLLADLGRRDDAVTEYEAAWRVFAARAPETFPQRLSCGMNLALLHVRTANWSRAESLYRDLAPALLAAQGAKSLQHAIARFDLAMCLEARGDFAAAVTEVQAAIEFTRTQNDGNVALRLARMRGGLARLLWRCGRRREAEPVLAELASHARRDAARPSIVAAWQFARGLCATSDGDAATAQEAFAAVTAITKLDEHARWLRPAAAWRLAGPANDLPGVERATSELAELLGPGHVETLDAKGLWAELAVQSGDRETAARLRAEVERGRPR